MIVRASPLLAPLPPPANVAVLHRLRVTFRAGRAVDRSTEATCDLAIVRAVIGRSKWLQGEIRARRDHIAVLGHGALKRHDKVCIQAELKDRSSLRFARELRVDR